MGKIPGTAYWLAAAALLWPGVGGPGLGGAVAYPQSAAEAAASSPGSVSGVTTSNPAPTSSPAPASSPDPASRPASTSVPPPAKATSSNPPPAIASDEPAPPSPASTTGEGEGAGGRSSQEARDANAWSLFAVGGFQQPDGDDEAVKYLQYRDIGHPFALPVLDLRVRRWDLESRLDVVDAGEDDAVYWLGTGKPGLFGAHLGWGALPHRLADEAVTLHHVMNGNRLLIPDSIQQALQLAPFLLRPTLKNNASSVDLETKRETTRAGAWFSPLRGLVLSIAGEEERRRGRIPRSVSTNLVTGADVTEFAAPIRYDTRRTTLGAEYTRGALFLGTSVSFMKFDNRVGDSLIVDNPLRAVDAEGVSASSGDRNRSAKSFLVSENPDNEDRQVSIQGSFALPHRMRVSGSYGWGRVEARTDFLPYTSNSAIFPNIFFPALPAKTFDAKLETKRYDAILTGNPLRMLFFKVFLRGYEYDNRTPSYLFPAYVVGDTRLAIVPRLSLPYGWKKDGGGAELKMVVLPELSLIAGVDRTTVKRTFREVDRTDEDSLHVGIDTRPLKWLFLRGSVTNLRKDGTGYEPHAYLQSYPNGVPGDAASLDLLRRYDVADRTRRIADIFVLFDMGDGFTIDVSAKQRKDRFPRSQYGLRDDASRNLVLGLTFVPFSPCTVHVERDKEFLTRRLNVRFRPILFGQPAESSKNDWSDELTENIHTVSVAMLCRDEDGAWDFDVSSLTSTDRQTDDAAYTSGTLADFQYEAHARNHGPTKRTISQTNLSSRFRLSSNFDLLLRAVFEKYLVGDPTQDLMTANMGRIDGGAFESAFLGAHVDDYSTRLFSILLGAHW